MERDVITLICCWEGYFKSSPSTSTLASTDAYVVLPFCHMLSCHWGARALPKVCRVPTNEICGFKNYYGVQETETSRLHYIELFTRPNYLILNIFVRSVYSCDFKGCDCHPGVCNKPLTVCASRYPP